jgi:hypothetical protein
LAVLETVEPAIDSKGYGANIVPVRKRIEPVFCPFMKGRLEGVVGSSRKIRVIFKIDPDGLPSFPVRGSAGHLQQPVAAIAEAVTRLSVAKFSGFVRIAETIDPLGKLFRLADEIRSFLVGNGGRMVADAVNIEYSASG